MTLGELIAALEEADQSLVVPDGFSRPHSYRGYYDQLAFEPARNVTVAHMLSEAKSALGMTFEGYKGGDFVMRECTEVWIAEYGHSGGEQISARLLGYMLREAATVARPAPGDALADTVENVVGVVEVLEALDRRSGILGPDYSDQARAVLAHLREQRAKDEPPAETEEECQLCEQEADLPPGSFTPHEHAPAPGDALKAAAEALIRAKAWIAWAVTYGSDHGDCLASSMVEEQIDAALAMIEEETKR